MNKMQLRKLDFSNGGTMTEKVIQTLRVAAKTPPGKTAGAIVRFIEEGCEVELLAVGAGAVNQAVKALAIGRGYAATMGLDLTCKPGFRDIEIEDVAKTAIILRVATS
jgi:stage V sporulation protein S